MDDFWPDLHEDKYARLRLKRSVELLQAEPLHSVLDIGCHQKEALRYLPAGCNYVGMDHIYGHDFDGGIPVGKIYDRILCLEVLEHLKYPRQTLRSIAKHLHPDGICVISLPNEATLFHRIRSLFGVVDAECFGEAGKHLHLPSLKQSMFFVSAVLQVDQIFFYIAPSCRGSRQQGLGILLSIIPDRVWQFLADKFPSLFARGFIFMCRKNPEDARAYTGHPF